MQPKILLLDPPHKIFGALRMWMPSPGLMSITAFIEANGFNVDLMDATLFDQPWTDLERKLMQEKYDRLKSRSGGKRAIVAVARTLLIRMRRMLLDNNPYVIGLIAAN